MEWSCSPSFSPLAGEAVVDKLKSLHYTIRGLTSVSWGPGCGGSRVQTDLEPGSVCGEDGHDGSLLGRGTVAE